MWRSPLLASSRAASAVELAASVTTPGSFSVRKVRHWASATGNDMIVVMSARSTPGTASRHMLTGITTSRSIHRSRSKANMSSVTFTEPSMAFSMGMKPRSISPRSAADSTSGIDG